MIDRKTPYSQLALRHDPQGGTMNDETPEVDGMEVSRIVITRHLTDDGQDNVWAQATDQSGEPLGLVESLGLLRMTEDTLIRAAMGGDERD